MAVFFFVESFVKDNIRCIISLISTVIIIIMGYKLTMIIQKSNDNNKEIDNSSTINLNLKQQGEHDSNNINCNNISEIHIENKSQEEQEQAEEEEVEQGELSCSSLIESVSERIINEDDNNNNNNNKPHHRRSPKICCCGCPYHENMISSSISPINISCLSYREHIDDIHGLMTSDISKLLICGYISIINIAKIPNDIISLLYLYYGTYNILYTQIFIIKGSHKGRQPLLNKIECINLNHRLSYNINIYNVNNNNDDDDERDNDDDRENELTLSTMDNSWDTEENGICFESNINFEQLICNQVIDTINTMNNRYNNNNYFNNKSIYNAIFKCAGMTALGSNLSFNSNASIVIFKENSFLDNKCNDNNDVIGFEIKLPDLPKSQTYCAQTVYSKQYGLITNCRDNTFLFDIKNYVKMCNNDYLSDDDDDNIINNYYDEWQVLDRMNIKRNWASSLCIIDSNSNNINDKLFICSGGGNNKQRATEIYNFSENKWYSMKDMNISFLMQSGIHYDKITNRVFIGGGYKTERKMTYFDIYKNIWIDLCDTKYDHSEYPAIWFNKFVNNNILYITGNNRGDLGVLEYIDLRENKSQWTLISNHLQINQYIQTPQLFKHQTINNHNHNHHRNQSHHYPLQIRRNFV